MIWPSNGRPKSKGSMMTEDSMMTVWVRKGLTNQIVLYTRLTYVKPYQNILEQF